MLLAAEILGTKLDYIIVAVYFIAILGFGSYFGRFTKSTSEFFFGGQRFAWWLIAASLVATGIGSYSFIKYAQAGFNHGTSSTLTYLNDWLIIPLFMFGWLPIIYFSRIKSIPEYFLRRFDARTRLVATIFTLVYLIGYIGLNFYLLGIALQAMLGIPMEYSIPAVAVISAIYVTLGGQSAVIFTDLVQGFFLYAAGAVLLFLGIAYVGGWGSWWDGLDLAHRLPFPSFNRPPNFNFAGIFWNEGIVGTMAFTFMNQGFIMRYLAVKSVHEGRKTLVFNTLILMPISAIVVGNIGWIAASMLTKGTLPEAAMNSKEVFVHVAHVLCKPGLFGFVIAALTAALMSTIDTLINATTAISVYDIYKAYVKKDATDKHYLNVARVFSISATVLGLAMVPVFMTSDSIFAAHYAFVGAITPPMLVAIGLGILWKRFTPQAAFWSMIIGGGLILVSIFIPHLVTPFGWTHGMQGPEEGKVLYGLSGMKVYKYFRAVYGLFITGALAVIITYFTKPKPESEIEGLTLGTIRKAKIKFKGGEPNEKIGGTVTVGLKPIEGESETVSLTQKALDVLKAEPGDLLYIADERKILGGLRSLHIKAGAPHDEGDVALLSKEMIDAGNLLADKDLIIEKVI